MAEDSGNSDSGAADGQSGSGSWLGSAVNSVSDFLHDHGPHSAMSDAQKDAAQAPFRVLLGDGAAPQDAPPGIIPPQTTPSAGTPAPKPVPTDMQLAHAALICGYTAKDAPRLMDDNGLAAHFGTSPNIIAASPDAFYRRWVIKDSRAALDGCTVLPSMIVQQPQIAPQVSPDIWSWKAAESLFSRADHILREAAGGIFEPGLHMITGMIAKPVSDVAGLAATAYDAVNGTDDASRAGNFRKDAQDYFTYQPRTEAGASIYNPQNAIPAWFGKLLELTLPGAPKDASTAGGMFMNGVREGIPQMASILGAK